ncbi:MAG TPA: helicase-exonuclease AddAB subunit AddA [Verrucomicrobia subdivision 3 bacterium]|nr:helicase-exonuclease AddAB subunit AddA [Limisphaerales bacterium]
MESARTQNDSLTPSQRQAVDARGNVLVMAGAGTGKTETLVARCLDCLTRERASLDELLIVTFTESAAAKMRQRLRRAIETKTQEDSLNSQPSTLNFWHSQLALFDIAHIGTLHSFCLRLVREHFHELGLDPQLAILDEGEARQLANETLDEQFQAHYAGEDEFPLAVQNLIQIHGGGRDEKIRALILRLHNYSQTRPDAAGWLADQIKKFSTPEPTDWQRWLLIAITDWRDEWLPVLENLKGENEKAAELTGILQRLEKNFSRELAAEVLEQIVSADGNWPAKRKTILRKPLEDLFDEAAFLATLAPVKNDSDPLAEDWTWVRSHMESLLRLAQEFAEKFSDRKRSDGVLDFHDLEQFALKLLWDFSADKPTAVAEMWRGKLKFVFVDEYQDINAAQDKIIAALSRDGADANRFLVGDVKQSIYRFRLADPKIFRDYSKNWRGKNSQVIPLAENFRSREGLLNFANSVFSLVLREEIGGVAYDADAQLKFGTPEKRVNLGVAKNPPPRVELLLRTKKKAGEISDDENGDLADLDETTKEARLIAQRLKQLVAEQHEIWDEEKKLFRPAQFGDLAILLRSPRGKSEVYAKEFERAGVPLSVARGGFFESAEILDLLSLLQLLDNPLQDVPCIAVLRSPLVGLSLDELVEIRLTTKGHFWTALNRIQNEKLKIKNGAAEKTPKFLERFSRWRKLAKRNSLSECLEAVLAETLYADWLRAQPCGAQRAANIERFLNLAQSFDQFQRQGLFRFLKFIEAQQEAGSEPDAPAIPTENAVRLMSIHQSKGDEFPVVALPDLAKTFNEQDLRGEIIFDEEFGLCPKVKPPSSGRRYPSLPHWLAQRRQKRELRGEELRLLYVALTRARDTLVLSATITEKKWGTVWSQPEPVTPQKIADAKCFADWLGLWFAQNADGAGATGGETPHLRWRLVDDAELGDDSVRRSRGDEAQNKENLETPHVVSYNDKNVATFDAAAVEKLRAVLSWENPHAAATKRKAKSSVTELRRTAEELDEEAEPVFTRPKFAAKNRKLSAAESGTAHHKFLQHFALEKTGGLAAEAERLVRENYLSADERAVLDLDALAAFWDSDLGEKIRVNAEKVRRELPFTARFSPAEIAEITGGKTDTTLADEFVVVQGVADLVVLLPQEIWLVDFKTDEAGKNDLPEKIKTYAPQLKLYAAALEKIFARKITLRALHFFAVRRTEKV